MGEEAPEPPTLGTRSRLECRECLLAESGKLITLDHKANPRIPGESSPEASSLTPDKVVNSTLMNLLRHSSSSYSLPSGLLNQEYIRKLYKSKGSKVGHPNDGNLTSSTSKSMQELSVYSTEEKSEETVFDSSTNETIRSEKYSKETKNEMVKRKQESKSMKNKKNLEKGDFPIISSSKSYLIGAVNLDSDKNVETFDFGQNVASSVHVYSTTAMTKKDFDVCDPPEKKKEDVECEKKHTKKNKSESKEKKKHKSEKVCEEKCNVCKVCKKEKRKKAKKEKKCAKAAKSKGRRIKKVKCSSSGENSPVQVAYASTNDKKKCRDYHFKTKNMFKGPNKRCCECRPTYPSHRHERRGYCHVNDHSQEYAEESDSDCEHSLNAGKCARRNKNHSTRRPQEKPKEACGVGNFLRNLRSLYPRFSYLKFLPLIRYCEKEKEGELSKKARSRREDGCESESDEDGRKVHYRLEEYDDDGHNCERWTRSHHHEPSSHADGCKCVRVYLQSHLQDEKPMSSESVSNKLSCSEETSSSSENSEQEDCSSETKYRRWYIRPDEDFMFPYRRSQIYYVGRATEDKKEKKRDKKKRKKEKKQEKKEKHKKKKENKENKDERENCLCPNCGRVHKKKHSKRHEHGKKHKKHEVTYDETCRRDERECHDDTSPADNVDYSEPKKEPEAVEPTHSPMFGFLRNWCSRKPKEPNTSSKSSIFHRLSETRYLKVCKCKGLKDFGKSKNKSKKHHGKKEKHKREKDKRESSDVEVECDCRPHEKNNKEEETEMTDTEPTNAESSIMCKCQPKLDEIEERLDILEKKKKKKKKEKSDSSENSNDKKCISPTEDEGKESESYEEKNKHGDSDSCCCKCDDKSNKKKKKKNKKKEKKEKKKKKKKRNSCGSSEEDGEKDERSDCSDETEHKKKHKKNKKKVHNSDECSDDENAKKKNKKKKKEKHSDCRCDDDDKKNKKNTKNRDSTTSSCEDHCNEVSAYYCTCASSPATPNTEATTEEKSTVSSRAGSHKIGKVIREKLSSFQSFWRRRHVFKSQNGKRTLNLNKDNNMNGILLDDCSLSSPVPKTREVHGLKHEPTPLFKVKRKKGKETNGDNRNRNRQSNDNKKGNKAKKETRENKSFEKYDRNSKSRSKRP